MRLPITVDRRGRAPLNRQVYEELRRGILAGRLAPGDRVPSTRELADGLRLSRATVAVAYDQLVAEGYLESRLGAGTFVCREIPGQPPPHRRAQAPRAERVAIRLSSLVSRLGPMEPRRTAPVGVVNLSAPAPDAALFPFAVWNRLMRHQLRRRADGLAGAPDGAGHERLREAVASYLGRSRAVQCRAAQVLVVSGSQQALDLCARVLVDPGDHVAMEEPGYPEGRQLFTAAGAIVHPVPVDADGLLVGRIPAPVRLTFVTPSHQYPSGVSLSLARRLELLAWARASQGVVLEDDYDSEFRYGGTPLPSLQGLMNEAARVVYVGTFSTAMFAGLRLGYVVLPPMLIEPFARAKRCASGPTATLEQAVLADFIREGHLERHIRRMRRVYKRRRDALVEALEQHLGGRATLVGDAAGLHVVVRVAGPDLAARAGHGGVTFETTRACYAGPAPANEIVVRFAGLSERMLREGVRRLATLVSRR